MEQSALLPCLGCSRPSLAAKQALSLRKEREQEKGRKERRSRPKILAGSSHLPFFLPLELGRSWPRERKEVHSLENKEIILHEKQTLPPPMLPNSCHYPLSALFQVEMNALAFSHFLCGTFPFHTRASTHRKNRRFLLSQLLRRQV